MDCFVVLICLTIGVSSAVYYYFQKKFSYWKDRGVNYLEPSFPLGNFPFKKIVFKDFFDSIYKQKDEKPFVGGYVSATPMVVATDLDFVKRVLVKDFSNFHDRGMYYNEKDDPLSAHLFALDGQKWRALRGKLTPTFTSGKMKFMFPTVVEIAERFNQTINEIIKTEQVLEIRELLARFTTDIIGTCAFGIECNSLKNPKSEFREYGRKIFGEQRHGLMLQILMSLFPKFARKLRLKITRDDVSDFFLNCVRETVDYREKNNVRRNDFMDLLIQLKNNDSLEGEHSQELGKLSFEDIAAQAFLFFLAGFETSSTTMTFTLYELALNQDIQERAREEINRVLTSHNRVLTYEAVKEMTYLDQIITESIRKYPPLVNIVRCAAADYEVPEIETIIEKGISVIIPVYSIHHDPDIFPDPEIFDPDRFLPDRIQSRHPMSFLGFGDGPRNCIGLRFGKMQSRVGLIMLVKNFRFTTCSKTPNPIVYAPVNPILTPIEGVHLKVEKVM